MVAGYIHLTICKGMGLQVTDRYNEHALENVKNVNGATIMSDVPAVTDRKILANRPDTVLRDKDIHIRKGPKKVGFVGIFQAFRNAIKLFSRVHYFSLVSIIFLLFLDFSFFVGLGVNSLFERFFLVGFIIFLACTRLGVYTVMVAGWSSDSGYSLLGGLRGLAQTILCEVRLAFVLLSFVILVCRYD
jgi:NADH:ubiquinone oxidoreductase subunit H